MAAPAAEAVAARVGPSFRVGRKQVYLPNHVISLVHPRKKLLPNFATFSVPLKFNKLDLRDYLYHVYNVEVRAVRSMTVPASARQAIEETGNEHLYYTGAWYRPQPQKYMMVELVKPFVLPEKPADLSPWDQDLYDRLRQGSEKHIKSRNMQEKPPLRDTVGPTGMEVLTAKEARDLVDGKLKWTNDVVLDEKWTEMKKIEEASGKRI